MKNQTNTQKKFSDPLWSQVESLKSFPSLQNDLSTDVCIVGAGIAGISCAYRLSQEGKEVVVVDDGPIAGGETCRSTAHLASEIDDRVFKIEQLHGREGARIAVESHAAAINEIERIIQNEKIECDFERVDGYLFSHSDDISILEQEYEAAKRAGLKVEKVTQAPLSFQTGLALQFANQAQFNPVSYLNALTQILLKKGVRFFSNTFVSKIESSTPVKIRTQRSTILAQAVIVASNSPFNNTFVLHTKQAPYRTYTIGALIPPGTIPHALYWDTGNPYHYIRLHSFEDKELLIVGGEDHKTGQDQNPELHFQKLESWTRARFPIQSINLRWSGQVLEPIDGVAFIGPNPLDNPNIYLATGDSGMGITHGVIASILLTDLILKRKNSWLKLYDPSRKTLRALSSFAEENANVIWQYRDWFTWGQSNSPQKLNPKHGKIFRKKLSKIAVYRDEEKKLHSLSAICPHLGGLVRWNSAEKTWDCPCHGSRFDTSGKVLNGPAPHSLPVLKAFTHKSALKNFNPQRGKQ